MTIKCPIASKLGRGAAPARLGHIIERFAGEIHDVTPKQPTAAASTIPYEQRLNTDRMWALNEGGMHFEQESEVHKTLRRIARRLDELGIPYAIAGGMAMYFHGYRRFTEDVDIIVSAEGLAEVQRRLEGLGYIPLFKGSKNLRDSSSGVRIEFLISGQYPGDGRPKPVQFPDPANASCEIEGMSFLTLERLIELKLASGMLPGRRKDLGDVQELIRLLSLPRGFKERLNPYVQPLFDELWDELRHAPPQP